VEETRLVLDAATAVGLGFMIGLEREHHHEENEKDENPQGSALLGVRSFTLLAIFGWVTGYFTVALASPWIAAAGLAAIAALIVAAFFVDPSHARGLTTELAALITFALGILVHRERALAAALAVAVTLLLISKPWFARWVPKLRRVDLTASLQIAILLAIVLPLLPTEARDPWGALAPRRIGLFVTLIMGVSFVGYVLHRTVGARRGAGLTGLVGGLTSSTAVTAAMAQQARKSEAMIPTGQMATCLASAVMAGRIVVITAVVSRQVALALLPPLAAMLVVMLGGAAWKWRQSKRAEKDGAAETEVAIRNPLSIVAALKWGVFLSIVLVAAAIGQEYFGSRGLIAAAALSGFADVDAITLAVARQSDGGQLAAATAVLAIVVAASSNTVVKAGIAVVSGGWRYGRDVAIIFGLSLAAALATAAVLAMA
jgi:uncharacterized membrane protein (DUF4010 family)